MVNKNGSHSLGMGFRYQKQSKFSIGYVNMVRTGIDMVGYSGVSSSDPKLQEMWRAKRQDFKGQARDGDITLHCLLLNYTTSKRFITEEPFAYLISS
jgi:hypothetical protein